MTLPEPYEDTSKALFSDGCWYIMPRGTWTELIGYGDYPHKSVVYHQCRNHWKQHGNDGIWVSAVQYRISVNELSIACAHCGEVCPEPLQGLWKLHNFDSIQSDPS